MTFYNLLQKPTSANSGNYAIVFRMRVASDHPPAHISVVSDFDSDKNLPEVSTFASQIHEEQSNIIIQYYEDFRRLKDIWKRETMHLSSITDICMNAAYQEIIGMGNIAIPFILFAMQDEPDHWFWALKSITAEDPVLPEQRGDMIQMTTQWLQWGKNKGYLNE